jgi:hypothetical protein
MLIEAVKASNSVRLPEKILFIIDKQKNIIIEAIAILNLSYVSKLDIFLVSDLFQFNHPNIDCRMKRNCKKKLLQSLF